MVVLILLGVVVLAICGACILWIYEAEKYEIHKPKKPIEFEIPYSEGTIIKVKLKD